MLQKLELSTGVRPCAPREGVAGDGRCRMLKAATVGAAGPVGLQRNHLI